MENGTAPEGRLHPPPRLLERLQQIAGYVWDVSQPLVHSSYDNWHVWGFKIDEEKGKGHPTTQSANLASRPAAAAYRTFGPAESKEAAKSYAGSQEPGAKQDVPELRKEVLARVSLQGLREERAYHICTSLVRSNDPQAEHIVKPLEFLRIPAQQADKVSLVVSIFEHPGPNYLGNLIDFGPAWYAADLRKDDPLTTQNHMFGAREETEIPTFLDFAIGAVECLGILHHGQRVVHGEIRGDAFHFNKHTGKVKLLNLGSGLRTFEHGLTSSGWSSLSKELGAKTKLAYISPEQTGRMPAEPDSRTDIYSLGILFWTILTQKPVFDGQTPMDIIQGVLGRRIPPVSAIRPDCPESISRVIQKMTARNVAERYQSVRGLSFDLTHIQKLLGDGDLDGLENWKIATKDVSSFFFLPNNMVGRDKEREEVISVLERVARHHPTSSNFASSSLSSGSSFSADNQDNASSDGTSSVEAGERKLSKAAATHLPPSASNSQQSSYSSQVSVHSASNRWENNSMFSGIGASLLEGGKGSSDGAGSLTKRQNGQKFRRKGRCEIVSISGAAGLGKSCLVQSVQVEARRRGYFASSKFDSARGSNAPFEPLLKLLGSLFRQLYSEADTDPQLLRTITHFVRPAWPMLHRILGLPEFLVRLPTPQGKASPGQPLRAYNMSIRMEMRSDTSAASSHSQPGSYNSSAMGSQSSQDFLLTGSTTKSTRLMNIFLDVLRVFAQNKFICLCLDDLQFADEESLELLSQLIAAKMRIVIIITYRPHEMLPAKLRALLEPSDTQGFSKKDSLRITQITLAPLAEGDVIAYIASTLSRPQHEVTPLALVVQAKTAGNPFYIREMLDACHRKSSLFYDYTENRWNFDLDMIFKQFSSDQYQDLLDSDFVAKRLEELPSVTREILAWASLIGTSFSFALIRHLLIATAGFDPVDNKPPSKQVGSVEGLQAAIEAFIIVPTERDDEFSWTHDRYIAASQRFADSNRAERHYVIAQTLMKQYMSDESLHQSMASHICEAKTVIKERDIHRQSFRKILIQSAQSAAESGARPTAAKFYANCLYMLQDNPWDDGAEDVYYDETLQLFTRAAECNTRMGRYDEALELILTVLNKAKSPVDAAPAWILKSRLFTQRGDPQAAFRTLYRCLETLGIKLHESMTYEACDAEFERLTTKIQRLEKADIVSARSTEPNVAVVGAVFVEICSAAFWSDALGFFHMTLVMVNKHLSSGSFPQSAMAFLYLAMISISRFNMISFANEMGSLTLGLLERWGDANANAIYSFAVGHIQHPSSAFTLQMESSLEETIQTGDKASILLTFGLVAQLRFFSSEHLSDLEMFANYGPEEIPEWQKDTRGGTMIIAVRQLCRALQGKTQISPESETVFNDELHDKHAYLQWIKSTVHNGDRSIFFYEGLELPALFLFGKLSKAVEIGAACLHKVDLVWSSRLTRFVIFFYGLALAGQTWAKLEDPKIPQADGQHASTEKPSLVTETIAQLRVLLKKILDWSVVCDVNYLSLSKILEAQIAELQGLDGVALRMYEDALDHASAHSFLFEEALGNYLLAGFFLRKGARRPAKAALKEAVTLYKQLGAFGVANHIEAKHFLLLQGPTGDPRAVDVGVQTDFAGDFAPMHYVAQEGNETMQREISRDFVTESKEHRIGAWQGGAARADAGSGLPELDMIDLTSILESSQIISSVLNVDQLLKKMTEIILQSSGGLASLASILVEDDSGGWCVASMGNPEGGVQAQVPGLPLKETPAIAESVISYCTSFKEAVFLGDLLQDERFANVNEHWLKRNPRSKSVIAMPISHGEKPLLGVLYLEGEPNTFTDRNLTVLLWLCNQIGISYSNALTMKAIEKVSASNISMVSSQKRALAKAKEAEAKAKRAEAEALRSVELAEEAAKAKNLFLSNISHELRTPLNGVIGNSELLTYSGLSDEQAEIANSIRVSADLLLAVINDLLDWNRMEAAKMTLFIVEFSAQELVKEVIRSVSYSKKDKKGAKDVQIIQDIDLPDTLVLGDPIRLHQVLGNLVNNALKFTEVGSVTIGARIVLETPEALTMHFWVKDTGIGISPSQLEKLFIPFSQADASTARKYGGSGLGLSICRSLVENMMHGRIGLESEENVGTTAWFIIAFPKAPEAAPTATSEDDRIQPDTVPRRAETEPIVPQKPSEDKSETPRAAIRLCIAEDNPINQKIAINFVKKLGFPNVDAYENGMAAVEGIRQKARDGTPYSLVLMDCQMPVLDGYEATKLLRQDPTPAVRKILVVAMTASAIEGDREKCLAAGMDNYLAKPVPFQVLKSTLEKYLCQPSLPIPNLKSHANQAVQEVMESDGKAGSSS